MARWDDMRRVILAKDQEGTERIWLDTIEAGPGDLPRFIEMGRLVTRQSGGKRQAGVLLWLLVDALKSQDRWREALPVFAEIAALVPDDGTVREAVIEAASKGWPDREDLEVLLERSAVRGGVHSELESQVKILARALQIERGAYVYHKSGWGVGTVTEYDPARGRCVIDFRTRPGHEMDVDAAAKILERLPEDDIRVLALVDPRGLRKLAKESPLVVLKQVVGWYNNSVQLANVKAVLVPDSVAPSTWATWWKSAKKLALLDPRFDVGSGRNPRVEFHEVAEADFRSQVDSALKRCATVQARQKAVTDLATTVGADEEARAVLLEATERELERSLGTASARIGWEIVLAGLRNEDPVGRLSEVFALQDDPIKPVLDIHDDKVRGMAAQALVKAKDDGYARVIAAAKDSDDPVMAEVAIAAAKAKDDPETTTALLDAIDEKPALMPNMYAWYVRRLRKGKWDGRDYEAVALVRRVLKVMDAVEYRQRRDPNPKDKRAVMALGEVLGAESGKLVKEAAESADQDTASHLHDMIGAIRGLRGILVTRLQDSITGIHRGAAKVRTSDADAEPDAEPEAMSQIYMTNVGLERMRSEAARLENDEMPENRAEIARAREFGDLRENAEYHAAREKQGLLQARLDQIKSDVLRAVVITPDIVSTDTVSVGTKVQLKDAGGEEVTYTLFGPPDTDLDKGIINYLTPLGQALMGCGKGEQIRLEIEGEVRELEVLGIEKGL